MVHSSLVVIVAARALAVVVEGSRSSSSLLNSLHCQTIETATEIDSVDTE